MGVRLVSGTNPDELVETLWNETLDALFVKSTEAAHVAEIALQESRGWTAAARAARANPHP